MDGDFLYVSKFMDSTVRNGIPPYRTSVWSK
jgi:hypothetical protein